MLVSIKSKWPGLGRRRWKQDTNPLLAGEDDEEEAVEFLSMQSTFPDEFEADQEDQDDTDHEDHDEVELPSDHEQLDGDSNDEQSVSSEDTAPEEDSEDEDEDDQPTPVIKKASRSSSLPPRKLMLLRRLAARLKNRGRTTPLHIMCTPGIRTYTPEAVSTYLASSRGRNDAVTVNRRGMTPLHAALARLPHRHDIVDLLVTAVPLAMEMTDNAGMTPLHHAARNARLVSIETFELLLERHPYPSRALLAPDNNGDTPFGLYCSILEQSAIDSHESGNARKRLEQMGLPSGGAQHNMNEMEFIFSMMTDIGPLLDTSVPLVRAIANCRARPKPSPAPANQQQGANDNNANGNNGADQNGNNNNNNNNNQENQIQQEPQEPFKGEYYDSDKPWDGVLRAALIAVDRALRQNSDATSSSSSSQAQQDQKYKFFLRSVLRWTHRQTSEADSKGNTPLHLAASVPRLNRLPPHDSSELLAPTPFCKQGQVEGIVDALARLHPDAARARNTQDLLPFDVAKRDGNATWANEGLGVIARANPIVLTERGGMNADETAVPELLSRIGSVPDSNYLGCVFAALRERPEVLMRTSDNV
uniref:Uncharacterized protein n=1 Tax=Odontella aurita TaxID=265563 RepID=A0A6U6GQ58_9STRA|mmetsp:Transcript_41118/g.124216  ORF Transcript_41118/g.124216 Transcript_41118/m.124216 type:complete len:589 (+) Transcript_41118:54-1820(+)